MREDVKMSRCEDEKMLRRFEDEQMFRRCEDEKMFYRPPLLEESCAQTLSGKNIKTSFETGFETGLESLKTMEIEAKQCDKEGTLFWFSKREKKQARKNGPPQ